VIGPTSSNSGSDVKSKVLADTDIVELIGQTVALKRRGSEFVGLCPFHQEKTPSFHVKPADHYFYCFGCKKGGNVIDFVMNRDRVDFKQAMRTLADALGIEFNPGDAQRSREQASERDTLLKANSAACQFYKKYFAGPAGAAARTYLLERGISAESFERFKIGLSPDAWDGLLRSEVGQKTSASWLSAAGLAKRRESGDGYYDTFRNRIMFPICDERSRVIAFGGRVMPGSTDPAKYLNSPETPLFAKGRCMFGLDLARAKIVETRTAVIVEGYTDVVVAHQYGVTNVIAVLGTGITEHHISILRRLADRIVLLFDGDTAGDAAVDRSVELFLTQPVELCIATLPAGMDPDELLIKQGAPAFEKLISEAPDALSYKWTQLARRVASPESGLTQTQQALEHYLSVMAQAQNAGFVDNLRWHQALSRVSKMVDVPVEVLGKRIRAMQKPRRSVRQGASSGSGQPTTDDSALATSLPGENSGINLSLPSGRRRAEATILAVLMLEPGRWATTQKIVAPVDFTDEQLRLLAEHYWNHQREEGEPVFNEFLGILSEHGLSDVAVEIVENVKAAAASGLEYAALEKQLAGALDNIVQERSQKLQRQTLARIRQTADDAETQVIELLRQQMEQARRPDMRRTPGAAASSL
jgi:DNA primase